MEVRDFNFLVSFMVAKLEDTPTWDTQLTLAWGASMYMNKFHREEKREEKKSVEE